MKHKNALSLYDKNGQYAAQTKCDFSSRDAAIVPSEKIGNWNGISSAQLKHDI